MRKLLDKLKKLKYRNDTIPLEKTPFYQTWEYRGNQNLKSADSRGVVSNRYKFFYNRIPKVANSTITSTLGGIETGQSLTSPETKKYFSTPSQMTLNQIKQFDKYYKFTFVRNPYTRTLSAYLDKVIRKRYLSKEGNVKNSFFSKREAPPTFSEFCEYLEAEGLYSNVHWAPQTDLLLLPFEEFDFIGRFEKLTVDLNYIIGKIFNHSQIVEYKHAGPPATNANHLVEKYYSDKEFDIVYKLYKDDFDLFGY